MKSLSQNDLLNIAHGIIDNNTNIPLNKISVNIEVSPELLKNLDEYFYLKSNPDKTINKDFKYGDSIQVNMDGILFNIKKRD